uniref:Uncharacterized protein n=1 Tax=Arundo donax TaxID=35708 RepID=A0A0A9EWG2_ARUDO
MEAVAVPPSVASLLGDRATAVHQEAAHHAVQAHGARLRFILLSRRRQQLGRRGPQELSVEQPLQHRPRRHRGRIGRTGPHVDAKKGTSPAVSPRDAIVCFTGRRRHGRGGDPSMMRSERLGFFFISFGSIFLVQISGGKRTRRRVRFKSGGRRRGGYDAWCSTCCS